MVLPAGRGKRRPGLAGRAGHARCIGTPRRQKGNAWAFGALSGPPRRCDSVRLPVSSTWHLPATTMRETDLLPLLHRIADALERLAPTGAAVNDLGAADAFVWHADREWLEPVPTVNRVPIGAVARDRPGARHPAGEHRALRGRAAGQQRAAVGRARHRQERPGQGDARRGQRGQARACPARWR